MKKLIILDLDHTILHSINSNVYNKFNYDYIYNGTLTSEFIIIHRPFLQDFFRYLFRYFYVGVWSAGTKSYVQIIVDDIFKNYKDQLKFVLHYDHCMFMNELDKNWKDLDLIWNYYKNFNKSNTILLDDTDQVIKYVNNWIRIPKFDIFKTKDDKILLYIMQYLDTIKSKNNINYNHNIKIKLN